MTTPGERAFWSAWEATFGTDWKNWNQCGIRWWSYAALVAALVSGGVLINEAQNITLDERGLAIPEDSLATVGLSTAGFLLPTVFLFARWFSNYGADKREFTDDDLREKFGE